jgi:cold shock CspA family protein
VTGNVVRFDDRRGIGEIAGDDRQVYFFHCTVIADGSRTIAVGTAVEFEAVPGHQGRWEAASIVPVTPGDK